MEIKNKELSYAIERAINMLNNRRDSELEDMYDWMDNAYRSYWTLPDELVSEEVNWVHRVTSTDPHDAVRAGTRTLATVQPRLELMPLFDNEESRETANDVEKALSWIFELASRRPAVNVLRDVVLSSLLYDEVIIGVWYLPYHMKIAEKLQRDTARMKNARRFGDFFIKVYNPRDAIVEYSDLQAERVLLRSIVTIQELVDEWGDISPEIVAQLDSDEHRYATIYDYHEIGWRSTWCYLQADSINFEGIAHTGGIELVNEKTPYDFLPISAKIGGTTLTNDDRYKRVPLLWSVYNSGQWETQNILETLLVSEGLAYSVSPRYALTNEFDTGDVPDVDFRSPSRIVPLGRGQQLQDLRPPTLNNGLEMLSERISARMDKSTVPRVLQSGDYPSGSAFASLNLATQSGMKSLTPYKELAEQSLVQMFINILNWVHFSGDEVKTYVKKPTVAPASFDGLPISDFQAEPISLNKDMFDIENIYLKVRLTEDVPTDYMAKINAGANLVERLGSSYQKALEFVGETDPVSAMRLREAENLRLAENQAEQKRILNDVDLGFMKMQEELQQKLEQVNQIMMQLEQMMAQAQAGGQGGPGGPGGPTPPMGGGPGAEGPPMGGGMMGPGGPPMGPGPASPFPGGAGMDPAQGGSPPAMAGPGIGLREEAQAVEGE